MLTFSSLIAFVTPSDFIKVTVNSPQWDLNRGTAIYAQCLSLHETSMKLNLRTRDTLGLIVLSLVERLSLSRR